MSDVVAPGVPPDVGVPPLPPDAGAATVVAVVSPAGDVTPGTVVTVGAVVVVEPSSAAAQTRAVMVFCCSVTSSPRARRRPWRSLTLDPVTLTVLRRHRRLQLEERMRWGRTNDELDLVFAREDGSPVRPDTVTRQFAELAKSAGLPKIRVHDLRHTYATIALSSGAHAKVVAERLGHATIGITLDTYTHLMPALEEQTAARVARLIVGDLPS